MFSLDVAAQRTPADTAGIRWGSLGSQVPPRGTSRHPRGSARNPLVCPTRPRSCRHFRSAPRGSAKRAPLPSRFRAVLQMSNRLPSTPMALLLCPQDVDGRHCDVHNGRKLAWSVESSHEKASGQKAHALDRDPTHSDVRQRPRAGGRRRDHRSHVWLSNHRNHVRLPNESVPHHGAHLWLKHRGRLPTDASPGDGCAVRGRTQTGRRGRASRTVPAPGRVPRSATCGW